MQFVLDCSVAISWCLVDENDDYANALLEMMPDYEAFVPLIWSLEVANTLLVAERRNRMTTEQSELAIALLSLAYGRVLLECFVRKCFLAFAT
jgi:predicted nucleic acid-binding protein